MIHYVSLTGEADADLLKTVSISDLNNIKALYLSKNYGSFAALKEEGTVATWGNPDMGGDSSAVQPS